MILSAGIKKIYESIKGIKDENKKKELVKSLENKIIESKVLSHVFGLISEVNSKAGKLDQIGTNKFFKELKEKHDAFVTENKLGKASIMNEEKKLLEFFNVNLKDVQPTKIDLFIDGHKNTIREDVVRNIVFNKASGKLKALKEAKVAVIKEGYMDIRENADFVSLQERLDLMETKAKRFSGKLKEMVDSSVVSIKEESYKNFNSAVNKAYKLNMLTELIRTPGDETTDNEYEDIEKGGNEVNVMISDMTYIHDISVSISKDQDRAIEIFFKLRLYPITRRDSDWIIQAPKIRSLLKQFERITINKFIYQTGLHDILNPVGTKWIPTVAGNFFPTDKKKDVIVKAAALEIILHYQKDALYTVNAVRPTDTKLKVGDVGGIEDIRDAVASFLKDFDSFLPTVHELEAYLNPKAQQEHTAAHGTGRSTEYKSVKGTADEYYNDKRTGDTNEDDNPLIIGDARLDPEHGEKPLGQDKEFVGDSWKKYEPSPEDARDDDQFDQTVTNKLIRGRKPKPGQTPPGQKKQIIKKAQPQDDEEDEVPVEATNEPLEV